jgi:signal peptidase I
MRTTTARRVARRAARSLLALTLTVGALGFLGLVVGPHVLGYRTAAMTTDSMTGTIDRGDLVVSVPRPARDVQVGDVLTVRAPGAGHRADARRVVAVGHTGGQTFVRTQGDANTAPDPWRTTISGGTVWRTAYVVPELGHVVQAVRATVVRYGAVWIALAGIVLLGLSLVWRSNPPGRDRGAKHLSTRPRLTLVTSEHRA